MSDNRPIRILPLRCGSIEISKDCAGGERFYLPAARAHAPANRRETLPVYAFLIEHPKGRILIDAGLSRDISPAGYYNRHAAASVLGPTLSAFYRPHVPKGEAIHEQLDSLGLRPEDIDYVLLTHLDADHVCGLRHLKGAKHIICSQEDYFWSCRTVYRLRYPRALWYSDRLESFYFKGSDFGPFLWTKDFFGDESVMLVHLPGHTEGSYGIMVQRNGRFALLTGDAAYNERSWKELTVPGFGFNPQRQLKSLQWIQEKSQTPGCVAVLASHDSGMTEAWIEL